MLTTRLLKKYFSATVGAAETRRIILQARKCLKNGAKQKSCCAWTHECRALQGSSNAAGGGTPGAAERREAQERCCAWTHECRERREAQERCCAWTHECRERREAQERCCAWMHECRALQGSSNAAGGGTEGTAAFCFGWLKKSGMNFFSVLK